MQTELDRYLHVKSNKKEKPKQLPSKVYKCPICGKEFSTRKGLCIHMNNAKDHRENPPLFYPNEGIDVATNGSVTELRIKMKRKLWDALRKRALEENAGLMEFFFDILVNASAFGRNYKLWSIHNEEQSYPYIS